MTHVEIALGIATVSFIQSTVAIVLQIRRTSELKGIQAAIPGKSKLCTKCHKFVRRFTPQSDGSIICANCK